MSDFLEQVFAATRSETPGYKGFCYFFPEGWNNHVWLKTRHENLLDVTPFLCLVTVWSGRPTVLIRRPTVWSGRPTV